MASKNEMLQRVRVALGRTASTPAPIPLARFSCGTTRETGQRLLAQFCAEAERVGTLVAHVQSSTEIKSYLAGISLGDKPATVALSNSKTVHDAGIRQWFISRDVQVIPSINEFASNQSETFKAGEASLMSNYKRALMTASLGVTSADYAIADTGTLVLLSGNEQHRLISLLPPTHLCLLDPSRIVANLSSLFACVYNDYHFSNTPPLAMTFITGPSRTADIELTLTVGVHGPRKTHILIHSPKR